MSQAVWRCPECGWDTWADWPCVPCQNEIAKREVEQVAIRRERPLGSGDPSGLPVTE